MKQKIKQTLKFLIGKVIGVFPLRLKQYAVKLFEKAANSIRNMYFPAVQELIKQSIVNVNAGNYKEAEQNLLQAATLCPNDARIAPYLSRVRFLHSRSTDSSKQAETRKMLSLMDAMKKEIESNPIYVPGDFWGTVGKFHLQLLEQYGVENFKRTVSHHYQNWFMTSQEESQVRELFKTWPKNFTTEPWFNIIEIPDHVGLQPSWNFNDPVYPLADAGQREIYRVAVGLLWEFVNSKDAFGVLNKLTESDIGNPLRIWRKGTLISSDLAHSVRERNILLEALSLKGNEGLIVGELGAGHGRLADIFGRTTNFRHFIFDITPALFVSQWYIKSLFPNEKIFEFRHFDDFEEIRNELKDCRFAFFTSNQIEKLPADYLDLFINLNSLAEMRLDQIKNFLGHIDRLTKSAFLSRQQIKSRNPIEQTTLTKKDYAMSNRWRLIVDKGDDIYPEYFNQIWKR